MSDPIGWLHGDARRTAGPGELLAGLCQRLVSADVPLSRATLTLETLHPLMAAATYEWQHGRSDALEAPHFRDPFGAGLLPKAPRTPPHGDAAALLIPVTFSDGTTHALSFWGHAPHGTGDAQTGFGPDETALLEAVGRAVAAPLEILTLRQMAATLMTTYLGRRTGERVLAGEIHRGDGETVRAILWCSDLRGFTELAEELPRDATLDILNAHFERLVAPIKAFCGEVLKFVGDGLLAIFPIDAAATEARACRQALRAARAARAGMAALNGERQARGDTVLEFGIALHLGEVTYGNIGAPDRLDFTVIGPTVNLTSRLEGLCKRLSCPVVTSATFAAHAEEPLPPLGSFALSGVTAPVEAFTLQELAMARPRDGTGGTAAI